MTESRKTSLQTALFWAYVVFAFLAGVVFLHGHSWGWFILNNAVLSYNLYWRGAVNHWREHVELWMRRRELILLEREMDDTDDDILDALAVDPASLALADLRVWMHELHTKRREVIDRMDYLHRVLGITPLRSLRQAAND